jgi:hypothetical protein
MWFSSTGGLPSFYNRPGLPYQELVNAPTRYIAVNSPFRSYTPSAPTTARIILPIYSFLIKNHIQISSYLFGSCGGLFEGTISLIIIKGQQNIFGTEVS